MAGVRRRFNPALPPKRQRKYGKQPIVTASCSCPECGAVRYRVPARTALRLIFEQTCLECGSSCSPYKIS